MKNSPLETQVDGSHYVTQNLQPIEAGYLLNATPCWVKLDKYLTRDKGDKLINLEKAKHCINIEEVFENSSTEKMAEIIGLPEDEPLQIASIGYHNKVCTEFLIEVVNLCTDNENYRKALIAMYQMDYQEALKYVDSEIEKEA